VAWATPLDCHPRRNRWAVRAALNADHACASRCIASTSYRPPLGVILTVAVAFGPPKASSDAAVIAECFANDANRIFPLGKSTK